MKKKNVSHCHILSFTISCASMWDYLLLLQLRLIDTILQNADNVI